MRSCAGFAPVKSAAKGDLVRSEPLLVVLEGVVGVMVALENCGTMARRVVEENERWVFRHNRDRLML